MWVQWRLKSACKSALSESHFFRWSIKTLISLIRVLMLHLKKRWILGYAKSAHWRLIRLCGFADWSESSMSTNANLFLLLDTLSNCFKCMVWISTQLHSDCLSYTKILQFWSILILIFKADALLALLTACWEISHVFLSSAFSKINFFQKKIFQEYHPSVKLFGSRSGPPLCKFGLWSILFSKIISRWQ